MRRILQIEALLVLRTEEKWGKIAGIYGLSVQEDTVAEAFEALEFGSKYHSSGSPGHIHFRSVSAMVPFSSLSYHRATASDLKE